ncbi:hypothetical protein JL721_6457 [Aureococcus anophagefferens]|nr:hypothetical protein JL721_6457 [Aureococcus anophagefferens]
MGGAASAAKRREYEVLLHVYDYAPAGVNGLMGMLGGGAGVFISGVEVGGVEYCFGEGGPRSQPPKQHPGGVRRKNSRPASHDLLRRNCNHYASALASALGAAPPPPWLNKLADATSTLGGLLGSFAGSFAAAAQSQPDPASPHAEATPVNQSARVPVAKAVAV